MHNAFNFNLFNFNIIIKFSFIKKASSIMKLSSFVSRLIFKIKKKNENEIVKLEVKERKNINVKRAENRQRKKFIMT